MNLTNIKSRILERLGRAGDTTLDSIITYSLENVQDEIINDIAFPELIALDGTSILLTADNPVYNLPDDFDQMIQIWDNINLNNELKRFSSIEYKTYIGDTLNANATNPQFYDIMDSAVSGSTYRKRIYLYPYPSTILSGMIATITNPNGIPALYADYNGTVSSAVRVTDAAHGLQTGMRVTIAGSANHNGTFTVTRIDADNFYIIATYTGTVAGGTWTAIGATLTDVGHGLATDDSITITGTTNYNGVVSVIKIDDDNFYIGTAYIAELGAITKTWTKNNYVPFVYKKHIAYLSATATENVLSYMYPSLYIEGGTYYLYRDNIYRDQPEKIAFRRSEFERVKNQVKKKVSQPDKINAVLPKRLLGTLQKLYSTQVTGYTS